MLLDVFVSSTGCAWPRSGPPAPSHGPIGFAELKALRRQAPTPGAYAAKTRYRQQDAACTLTAAPEGFALDFADAQWAVTPGQSAVLYDGEVCLGGGVINAVEGLGEAVR